MSDRPFRGLEPGASPAIPPHPKHGPEEVAYWYVDANGVPLFVVCRYRIEVDGEPDKTFLQGRPGANGHGWRWHLRGFEPVLYRFDEVAEHLARGSRDPMYVTEGEKDCDRLRAHLREHGLPGVVTTVPMGTHKWRASYTEALTGARHVAFLVDNDDPGIRGGRAAAAEVGPVADRVQVLRSELHHKGADLSDHLDAGLTLDDLVEIEEETADEVEEAPAEEPIGPVVFESLRDFADTPETGGEPVLGDTEQVVFAEGSDGMFYGTGGAGKTTLVVDLACHLAAGDAWLGIPVPAARNVLLIENEGPRPLFRQKAKRKLDAWAGSGFDAGRVTVLAKPWAEFTFADERWRVIVADHAREHEVDVVICGPLASAGMEAAGTLHDVREFQKLTADVRRRSGRDLLIILVHHENKGGQVSGAWEGAGDTLAHVSEQGPKSLRLYWQKTRWASAYNKTTMHLEWADEGDGFEVVDKPRLTREELADKIIAAVEEDPGATWGKIEKATTGVADGDRREVRDELLRAGRLVNVRGKEGEEVLLDHVPPRTAARLHLADDPVTSHLRLGSAPDQTQIASPGGEAADASASCGAPLKGTPQEDADADGYPRLGEDGLSWR